MHNDPLLEILILLAASICVVAGVRKLALPAILGYLVVGMLLGPHALALAVDNETTRLLADFGVVFLVFTLGLEFSLPRLVAMRWEVLGVGGAQVLGTTGIVAAVVIAVGGTAPAVAVVIGGAVAMSSTAIIISQLTEQSENNRTHGRLAVAICLFQDLSFPLFLALISALAGGGAGADIGQIAVAVGSAVLALLLVLAAGRWLLRPLFLLIASVRSAELFSLAVLLAVLASAWVTHKVGLSLALGAFLAGMMLAETEFRHQVEATIRSYKEVLLGLFFITVGMLLDVRLLFRDLALVTALLTVGAAATFRARPLRPIPFTAQVLLCGAVTGIVSGVVSAPVVAYLFGGVTGSGSALVVAIFLKAGENLMSAAMLSGLAADPPDKILQVLFAALLYRATPGELIAMLRPPTQVRLIR